MHKVLIWAFYLEIFLKPNSPLSWVSNLGLSQKTLSRLDEAFGNSTLILNDEDDRTILRELDEDFKTSTLILNDEDNRLGFAHLTCLAC